LEEVCLSQWLHDLDTSCYVEDLWEMDFVAMASTITQELPTPVHT
jgi:hypothetical protein